MSERVSRAALESRLERLNKALGRPVVPYRRIGDRTVAQIGCLHLDHCLGGWQIQEMCNESGGVTCPLGYWRMSSGELARMLDAVMAGVEMARQAARVDAEFVVGRD